MAFSDLEFDRYACRQLQHRRFLAFAQMCQQDELPVRQLKGVVMTVRLTPIDLSEPGHIVAEPAGKYHSGFASYLVVKGKRCLEASK